MTQQTAQEVRVRFMLTFVRTIGSSVGQPADFGTLLCDLQMECHLALESDHVLILPV